MSVKNTVLGILKELMPTKDLSNVNDMVEGGYIDSFELVSLIATLSERFGVEIDIDDVTPQNFNSVDDIVSLMSRLIEERKTY